MFWAQAPSEFDLQEANKERHGAGHKERPQYDDCTAAQVCLDALWIYGIGTVILNTMMLFFFNISPLRFLSQEATIKSIL